MVVALVALFLLVAGVDIFALVQIWGDHHPLFWLAVIIAFSVGGSSAHD